MSERRTPDRERIVGCLLGGAFGDALGAPLERLRTREEIHERFGPDGIADFAEAFGRVGAITDDTQMTIFTAEGLLRALNRSREQGSADVNAVVHHAYLRWLHAQGEPLPPTSGFSPERFDGWLAGVADLQHRRGPGSTCLSALLSGERGSILQPINDSKGCGGVMRAAPAGLIGHADSFLLGCELAAITHGHPSGYLAAGFQAALVDALVHGGALAEAIEAARTRLSDWPEHEECLVAVDRALSLAEAGGEPSMDEIEQLGEGWVAEEALAIALYCALVARDIEHGLRLAVNHVGDSDSTGAITGNLLGAMWGREAIPARWLERVELRAEIERLANDIADAVERPDEPIDQRAYPGW